MKRTPLRRRTPLGRGSIMRRAPLRRSPMRRGKSENSYAQRERAWLFMGWVKLQPCAIAVIGVAGVIDLKLNLETVDLFRCRHRFGQQWDVCEADHAGERIAGLGTKSKDRDTIPLCYGHHWDRTNSKGVFEHMTPEQREQWRELAIAHNHEQARRQGVEIPDC